jgi:hypothetical protein
MPGEGGHRPEEGVEVAAVGEGVEAAIRVEAIVRVEAARRRGGRPPPWRKVEAARCHRGSPPSWRPLTIVEAGSEWRPWREDLMRGGWSAATDLSGGGMNAATDLPWTEAHRNYDETQVQGDFILVRASGE